MMCWENLDNSEQASKKRKMNGQDAETNDDKEVQADEWMMKCTSSIHQIWGID